MDLESSKELDSEVQQFDEHPKPWTDGFYCLFKEIRHMNQMIQI